MEFMEKGKNWKGIGDQKMKMYDKLIRTIDIAIYNGKLYYIFRLGVLGLISNSFYYYIFKEFYYFFSL